MTIRLPLPIDPASTGADWAFDFTFTDLDGQPESWAGDQVTFVFVPKEVADRPGNAFELTSEGGGAVVLASGAAIRVLAADMADRLPGAYDFELIRRREDGAKIREVVGAAVIERSLEQIADGVAARTTALTGSAGVYRIERGANGVRVERGGGPQGDDAYRVAVREGYQGSRQEWLASLVGRTPTEAEIDALVAPRVASATADLALRLQALENAQPRTPPAWVFGASPLRTIGAGGTQGLYPPPSNRLTDAADVWITPQPAGWRIVYANFACNSDAIAVGAGRELMPGNSNIIDFAVAFTGANGTGERVQLTFDGATSIVMPDGGFAVSDPVSTPFAGGWVRTSITTPPGGKRPGGWDANAAFGEYRRTAGVTSPAWAAGGILTGGVPDTARGYQPIAVLVPGSAIPASVALFGDSITQQDDAKAFASVRGMLGGIVRGQDDVTGLGSFGVGNFGHHGASMVDFLDTAAGSLKYSQRYALLKYIKDVVNHGRWPMTAIWSQGLRNDFSGLNDATAEGALVQMKARAQAWWNWLHATFDGVPIIQSTVSPRVTADATTGYTTIEGQVPRQPTVSGGAQPAFNDWVVSKPAPLFLGVDLRSAMEEVGVQGPVIKRTAFTLAGGGTLSVALAAGVAVTTVTIAAATSPGDGVYLVFEPGTANFEQRGTILSVANNGNGTFTLTLLNAITPTKAHAVGAVVKTANSSDGTHLGSAMHRATAPLVAAVKGKIKSLVAA